MKILVRTTNWVGDAVMAIPALAAIRARWPDAEIVVLARPWVADLYRGQGYADRLIVFDNRGRHRGLLGTRAAGERTAAREIRRGAAIAECVRSGLAGVAGRNSGTHRLRARRAQLAADAGGSCTCKGRNSVSRSLLLSGIIAACGLAVATAHHRRIVLAACRPKRSKGRQERLVEAGARAGARRIAFAPGAAYGSAKCWDPQRYAALADRLIAAFDAEVILFGAPQENEMAGRIAQAMQRRALNLTGTTTIGELPALLATCRLFIGNDSGAMHVAGAVGVPVVGIFGPTDPAGTSPVTTSFTLVQEPVACSPCFLRHCPIDHRCMTRIAVDRVFAAAAAWLEGKATPGPSTMATMATMAIPATLPILANGKRSL